MLKIKIIVFALAIFFWIALFQSFAYTFIKGAWTVKCDGGVVISVVYPTSLAEFLGFKKYDQIIEINDTKIHEISDVRDIIQARGNANLTFVVRRNIELISIKVTQDHISNFKKSEFPYYASIDVLIKSQNSDSWTKFAKGLLRLAIKEDDKFWELQINDLTVKYADITSYCNGKSVQFGFDPRALIIDLIPDEISKELKKGYPMYHEITVQSNGEIFEKYGLYELKIVLNRAIKN
jgi:membrane-associated protease RseP (regulator of RpoE activity)